MKTVRNDILLFPKTISNWEFHRVFLTILWILNEKIESPHLLNLLKLIHIFLTSLPIAECVCTVSDFLASNSWSTSFETYILLPIWLQMSTTFFYPLLFFFFFFSPELLFYLLSLKAWEVALRPCYYNIALITST